MSALPCLTVLAASVAVACGGPHQEAPAGATRDEPGDGLAVRDDRGVVIGPVGRTGTIVSVVPSVTEILLALGAESQLVGRTRFDIDPRLAHLPLVGGSLDPNLETIIGLTPDLVVTWLVGSVGDEVSRIESLGMSAYAAEMRTTQDFHRHARNLGALTGRAAVADSLSRAVEGELSAVAASVRCRPRGDVLYVVWPEPLLTTGRGTFIDELIGKAGGRNVFGDLDAPFPIVSLEQVLIRQPDLVVVTDEHATGHFGAGWLVRAAGWRDLDAVKAGHVLRVEADLFVRPGPGMGRAARLLADALHPHRREC